MWLILTMFATAILTVITLLVWYPLSVLCCGPVFDPNKISAIICAWGAFSFVGSGILYIVFD